MAQSLQSPITDRRVLLKYQTGAFAGLRQICGTVSQLKAILSTEDLPTHVVDCIDFKDHHGSVRLLAQYPRYIVYVEVLPSDTTVSTQEMPMQLGLLALVLKDTIQYLQDTGAITPTGHLTFDLKNYQADALLAAAVEASLKAHGVEVPRMADRIITRLPTILALVTELVA